MTPARQAVSGAAVGLLLGLALPLSAFERKRFASPALRFVTHAQTTLRGVFEETIARILGL